MTTATSRRQFVRGIAVGAAAGFPAIVRPAQARRPNILFAISDDQSWEHASAYGDKMVKTPAFDQVAGAGVRFTRAFSLCPGCAPSRAGILTGRAIWQLEEAGTHASFFPRKWPVYTDLIRDAGYHVGLTQKGAGPCNWKESGWLHNPAGQSWDRQQVPKEKAIEGISRNDYAANFGEFLAAKPKDQPFCFWYGCSEPHRVFKKGIGKERGKRVADVRVPSFLPDAEEVRSDILDYYVEIEHFDTHLGRILDALKKAGELENTLVLATSDNGMAFPGAKANLYEHGVHLPLAISWPAEIRSGRVVDDIVSFMDFAPTFLESAGLRIPRTVTGKSLLPLLRSGRAGQVEAARRQVFFGRERHSHARFDNLGYPCRGIRTHDYLYIRNFKPDLWPAGDPEDYFDIDAAPAKTYMMDNRSDTAVAPLFHRCFGKRPEEELFDIHADPGCLRNLAALPEHTAAKKRLRAELDRTLRAQGDPRVTGRGDIFDSYPRFSPMRPHLGGFAQEGGYNPKYK
jgi:N-sulfoglucosamine sulfohydrolase